MGDDGFRKRWKEDIVIYKKKGKYSCFPLIRKLDEETVVVQFDARDKPTHFPIGGTQALMSHDKGKTWKRCPIRDNFTAITLPDGTLIDVQVGGWEYTNNPEEFERLGGRAIPLWNGVYAISSNKTIIRTSRDNGLTWQEKRSDYLSQRFGKNFFGDSHRGVILLNDQKTVILAINAGYAGEIISEVYLLRSQDFFQTFDCISVTGDFNKNHNILLCEPTLLELPDNKLIMMLRSQGEGEERYLYQVNSKDGSMTWSEPVQTDIWGYPPDLIYLNSGHILCSYGYRRSPFGIRCVISYDSGKTWDVENAKVLRDDSIVLNEFTGYGDVGYPVSIQFNDDTVLTVYYMTSPDGITHIAATRYYDNLISRPKVLTYSFPSTKPISNKKMRIDVLIKNPSKFFIKGMIKWDINPESSWQIEPINKKYQIKAEGKLGVGFTVHFDLNKRIIPFPEYYNYLIEDVQEELDSELKKTVGFIKKEWVLEKRKVEIGHFIKNWMVMGPFDLGLDKIVESGKIVPKDHPEDYPGKISYLPKPEGFDKVYPPEQEIILGKEYQGKEGSIKWTKWQARKDGYVDLENLNKFPCNVVAYALSYIHSKNQKKVILTFGSDGGAKIWLNDNEIYNRHIQRDVMFDEEIITIRLKAGWNTLLIKTEQLWIGCKFVVRVIDFEEDLILRDYPERRL